MSDTILYVIAVVGYLFALVALAVLLVMAVGFLLHVGWTLA